MSLHHTLLKTSLLLGSLGLVGVAVLRPAQAETMIGQSLGQAQSLLAQVQSTDPAPNPELSPNSNRQNPRLAQGQGRGQGPGSGQRCGPGRGQRGAHLTEAATQLGVTEEALRSALGIPAERPPRPDLAAAAAQLGTTEDELRESIYNVMREHRQNRQPGMPGDPPDFTALAQRYGVSADEFRQIVGMPNRPDIAAAAAQLGVTEEALREALRSAHGGRGPGMGGPGGGMMR